MPRLLSPATASTSRPTAVLWLLAAGLALALLRPLAAGEAVTGTIVVWGDNSRGQHNVPEGLTDVVAIAAGMYHSLALKSDGTVIAWDSKIMSQQTAVPKDLTHVVAIAAGESHSLALKSDGTVVAWGSNTAGQSSVPSDLSSVVAIAAGGFHSLALKNEWHGGGMGKQ